MRDKRQIQKLFTGIAASYDFLNHLLSLGTDRFWRRMAVSMMPGKGPCLDVCAGTLDLSIELAKSGKFSGRITALDFCPAMLLQGKKKLASQGQKTLEGMGIEIIAGDGEHLPLATGIYRGAMIGFGLRNIPDRQAGLKEILRVLRPGGRLVVLEFSLPVNPFFRKVYHLYFCHLLPVMGNTLSGGGDAYNHLRDSVLRFPDQERLTALLREVGFVGVGYRNLTCGIAAIHWGNKPFGA